jgi:DNA-binding NarL/FixJ family response regulator
MQEAGLYSSNFVLSLQERAGSGLQVFLNVLSNALNALTPTELKVLKCIAEGLRNREIADKLFNSEETIKKHIYHMFQKLEVKNRMSLVTRAKEEGIIDK